MTPSEALTLYTLAIAHLDTAESTTCLAQASSSARLARCYLSRLHPFLLSLSQSSHTHSPPTAAPAAESTSP
jgi:hypothetical protein